MTFFTALTFPKEQSVSVVNYAATEKRKWNPPPERRRTEKNRVLIQTSAYFQKISAFFFIFQTSK